MDLEDALDYLAKMIENARAMPLSTSCLVDRPEALALIGEIREMTARELQRAKLVLRDRDAIRAEALREAEAIRREAQEYADQQLANLEMVVSKALATVQRGRDQLHGASFGAPRELR